MVLGGDGEGHCVHGDRHEDDEYRHLLCGFEWLELKSSFPIIIGASFKVSFCWVTRWESAFAFALVVLGPGCPWRFPYDLEPPNLRVLLQHNKS